MSQWYVPRKPCTYLASRLALYPNGQNELPFEPRHLVVPSGASKTICKPMVHLAQTMHQSCTDTDTVSKRKRSQIPQDPRHLGVPSGASKMISEPIICSTQTVHLSCAKISTICLKGQNDLPVEPGYLVVPSSASKMIYEPLVRPAQTMHLSCIETNPASKRKEVRFQMTHVT